MVETGVTDTILFSFSVEGNGRSASTEFRAVSVFTVKKAKHVALAQQLCVFWYILLGRASVRPTLAGLHCNDACVCLFVCRDLPKNFN